MMIHAYRETFLPRVQAALGDAFDYAVNVCGMSGGSFAKAFAASSVSSRIECGDPAYVAGKSGIEMLADVVWETRGVELSIETRGRFGRSPDYWVGWAVAYCQWRSGKAFAEIFAVVGYGDLLCLYTNLHEADVSKVADVVDARMRESFPETNIKRMRAARGCSQAELARESGVGLRSIQMYEQRNKDINKASAESVRRLARVLGCPMESLLE